MMEPGLFYRERVNALENELKRLQQKKSAFGWLRFGSIAAIVVAFYVLWSLDIWYVIFESLCLIIIFIRLLLADLKNKAAIEHTICLIKINNDELQFLQGNYDIFPNGTEHAPSDHLYANDLDIFGPNSIFQYVNRTSSEMGGYQLAAYLKTPANKEIISGRQTALKELAKKTSWIQALQALGKEKKVSFSTKQRLENWIDEPPVFSKFKPWVWLRYLLPAMIISIVTLYIFDRLPSSIFYLSLLLFATIAYQINKYVAPIHETLSKIADEIDILSVSIAHIENTTFESPLLKELQSVLFHQNKNVSQDIQRLHKLLDRLDLRYNLVLSLPLNILLLWNLQQMLGLEKWKSEQRENIQKWFNTLGHMEALCSLGILHFNKPQWAFPVIVPEFFIIEGKEIGHPLIPETKVVRNDIKITGNGEIMLVTGSNMAGKSTYLRSIGVNVVLAMAGAPVCADYFQLSCVQMISSMRITDNLAESTSTFYAELKKLKTIIEKVNARERVFILLDEILRGTNSLDRHTGSVALVKQLIKHHAAAIIATHDLELAKLIEVFPSNIINYHFDVQVSNEELFFGYLLKPGVCTSLNASILMKKIGIEL